MDVNHGSDFVTISWVSSFELDSRPVSRVVRATRSLMPDHLVLGLPLLPLHLQNYFHDAFKTSLVGHSWVLRAAFAHRGLSTRDTDPCLSRLCLSAVVPSDNNGAEDKGHLRVTYHHNRFEKINSRGPSVRFGTLHAYSNSYKDVTDSAVNLRVGAQGLVEQNSFSNVRKRT